MRAVDQQLMRSARYDVFSRVTIEGYDLENILGYNPFISASWTAAADQLATQGQINLFLGREDNRSSTSPFMRNSSLFVSALPHAGKAFTLETSTVSKGGGAGAYDVVFDGRIDGADAAGDGSQTVLTCRDKMGYFLNRIIEPPAPPESPVGKNGFLVASAELGGWLTLLRNAAVPDLGLLGAVGLDTTIVGLGDPDWTVVDTWVGYGQSLAEKMNEAVLQRGWAFHYRYSPHPFGGLTYYDPERSSVAANYTVQPEEYIRVLKCTINDLDVRNLLDLTWGADRDRTRALDAASNAQYQRRYMAFSEDKSGQIDTQTEADRMLAAALADTKDPVVEFDYERFYFWPVELADKHYIVPTGILHGLALDVAVIGYTHSLSPKSMRSVIRTRGTAVAAGRRWRKNTQRTTHVSLGEPVGIAPEGAIWLQVDDLTPPA